MQRHWLHGAALRGHVDVIPRAAGVGVGELAPGPCSPGASVAVAHLYMLFSRAEILVISIVFKI